MNDKKLDSEIGHIFDCLKGIDPTTEEYVVAVQNLKTLYEARSKKRAAIVEWETVLAVAGNLIGILAILQFERLNVVSSRALSLIIRPK